MIYNKTVLFHVQWTYLVFYSITDVTPPLLILHAEDDVIVPYHLGQKVSVLNVSLVSCLGQCLLYALCGKCSSNQPAPPAQSF